MKSDLIEEFIDKKSLEAMQILVSTLKDDEAKDSAVQLANVFGAGEPFKKIANSEPEAEKKLIQSFHNNLILLIEKTWIEKTDEELKAQVKYHLEEFCRQLNACSYTPFSTGAAASTGEVPHFFSGCAVSMLWHQRHFLAPARTRSWQ